MRERLRKIRESIQEFVKKMTKRQKIIVGLAAGVIFLLLFVPILFLAIHATSPKMEVLYNNLTASDANAIITELRKNNVKYELADNGKQILVTEKEVAARRIELAGKGLPAGGTMGYELFDSNKLGATDFTQKVNFRRAIEGELSRTISGLEQIESAKIMVVMPEPSLFVTDPKKPTASVAIALKPKAELSEEQIRGIMNLVAHSIEGLTPEDVTIIDSQGNLISDIQKKKDERLRLQMSEIQLKQKVDMEERYEKKIKDYLSTVFGEENVVVAVTAELDFDKRERKDIDYIPLPGTEKGVTRSEQLISEKYLGTGSVPEIGVPGTTSNIPGYKGLTEGNAEYNRTEETRNYDITTHTTVQEDNPGDIARLQVAVILNEDIKYQGTEPYIRGQRRAELQDNIAKAANLDVNRGDGISLAVMKFKEKPGVTVSDQFAQQERFKRIMSIIYAIIAGIAVLGIILLAWFGLRNAVVPEEIPEEEEEEENLIEEPVPVEELLVPELTDEQRMREKIKEEVLRMIQDDPEGAALIVRSWLFED